MVLSQKWSLYDESKVEWKVCCAIVKIAIGKDWWNGIKSKPKAKYHQSDLQTHKYKVRHFTCDKHSL